VWSLVKHIEALLPHLVAFDHGQHIVELDLCSLVDSEQLDHVALTLQHLNSINRELDIIWHLFSRTVPVFSHWHVKDSRLYAGPVGFRKDSAQHFEQDFEKGEATIFEFLLWLLIFLLGLVLSDVVISTFAVIEADIGSIYVLIIWVL
jgi:hypothetical protein